MVVIFCVWQKNKVMLLSVAFILAFFSTEDPWVTKYWCSLSCYCFIVAMMLLIYCCYANVSLGFVSQRFVHKIYTECREWLKYGIGRFPELLYYICEKLMLLYIGIYIYTDPKNSGKNCAAPTQPVNSFCEMERRIHVGFFSNRTCSSPFLTAL